MSIHSKIAFSIHGQIENPVDGDLFQHVVKKPNSRIDRRATRAIDHELHLDLSFSGRSMYLSLTHDLLQFSQRGEQAVRVLRCAGADANVLAQARLVEVANDDPPGFQAFLQFGRRAALDTAQDEVRL